MIYQLLIYHIIFNPMKISENIISDYFSNLEFTLKSYKKHLSGIFDKSSILITPDQWQVLDIIVNHKDIKYSEIAVFSGKDIASVNRIIDLLNQKGYVSRQTDPNNRRRVILGVSNDGIKIHKRAGELINIESKKLLDGFKEKRIIKQVKIFKKIIRKCG